MKRIAPQGKRNNRDTQAPSVLTDRWGFSYGIAMRLSANPDDVGYKALRQMHCRGIHPMVRVNGEEVRNCITVDTKRGIAVVADMGDQCNLKIAANGNVKRKILTGDVSITFKRAYRPKNDG